MMVMIVTKVSNGNNSDIASSNTRNSSSNSNNRITGRAFSVYAPSKTKFALQGPPREVGTHQIKTQKSRTCTRGGTLGS